MNVVDSSGWLEYFVAGANADFFAPCAQQDDAANAAIRTITKKLTFLALMKFASSKQINSTDLSLIAE